MCAWTQYGLKHNINYKFNLWVVEAKVLSIVMMQSSPNKHSFYIIQAEIIVTKLNHIISILFYWLVNSNIHSFRGSLWYQINGIIWPRTLNNSRHSIPTVHTCCSTTAMFIAPLKHDPQRITLFRLLSPVTSCYYKTWHGASTNFMVIVISMRYVATETEIKITNWSETNTRYVSCKRFNLFCRLTCLWCVWYNECYSVTTSHHWSTDHRIRPHHALNKYNISDINLFFFYSCIPTTQS